MDVKKNYAIILFAGYVVFTSCSNTRHLPDGDKLYTGANVNIDGPSLLTRDKKVLRADLDALTRPKPNTKLLGVRLKLSIYNMFRNKKENSFFGRFREKNGEPPVLLSQLDLHQNTRVLQNHLENKGYFKATVTGDTIIKIGRASCRERGEMRGGDG